MSRVKIISASAGTGKTTRLAKLIHQAVESGQARPEAILATTFTNRAAAELAERARQTLLQVGQVDAAHRIHAARVGTVNGVCGGIVQDFAFLHGLSPRVKVLDERKARDEPLRAGITALPPELLRELDDLNTRLGPAGGQSSPGLGGGEWDWQQDVVRIMHLARSNAIGAERFPEFAQRSTDALLGFLQTPLAEAKALDSALEAALRVFLADEDVAADTFAKTKTARRVAAVALARGARNLRWTDWVGLAQLAPAKKLLANADPVVEAASAHDRHPRLHDDLRRAVTAVFEAAGHFLTAYQDHKRRLGVIDFVDQETEALKLLREPSVRAQLSEEIDLVLVDEFQDTSPIQLAIFLELSNIAPQSVWVGDPKQAIYGFRGADPALMDAAVVTLLEGEPPETLALSYRSRPELVRLTSDLFAPAFAESGIPEGLVRVDPGVEDEPEGLGPIFERWVLEPGVNAKTGKPQANAVNDLISLAAGVCALLDDPAARVRDPTTHQARAIEPGDVAVLCFRNDHCTGLARELESRGVRALVGRPGLVSTLEVRLALAALRLWIDPADTLARAELARWLDHSGDGEAWLTKVLEAKDRDALFADLPPVVALREAREPRAFAGVLAAFDAAMAAAGVRERVVTFGDATSRLANLDALRALVSNYVDLCRAEGTPCSPSNLLVHLDQLASELTDTQAAAERPDAVRICTLHSSKGLEWPVTVLADLTDRPEANALGIRLASETDKIDLDDPLAGRWLRYWPGPYGRKRKDIPFIDRLEEDEATQVAREAARREGLRLVYVAWTRARDRVVYAGRPGRMAKGQFTVLSAAGEPLLSEPSDSGRVSWGVADAKHEFDVVVRRLPPDRAEGGAPVATEGYLPSGPRVYPPATQSPSQLEGKGAVGEAIELGERIPIAIAAEDDAMRRFGDAVHSFLAADRQTLDASERTQLASGVLERFGVSGAVDASQLPVASDRFSDWIAKTWPGATWRREWPVQHRLPNGTVLRGVADLVLETDEGLVLLDHKSFPGNRKQAMERAGSYAGQLSGYAAALEAATGKRVLAAYIHLPVSGLAVEVRLQG